MSATDDNTLYFDVQQKTDKQHILDNPDTYIGSVETVYSNVWIMNETNDRIIEKNINYIPGLFKLFDEGIVNCRDHVVRMQSKIDQKVDNSLPVTYIDIAIQEDGTIVMINDGNGIDVVQHPEYKTWVPELIFGHLRTSTNYNKDEKKLLVVRMDLDSSWFLYGLNLVLLRRLIIFADLNIHKSSKIILTSFARQRLQRLPRQNHILKLHLNRIIKDWELMD